MAKTIFRKIGGRVVPIKLGSFKSPSNMGFTDSRVLTAKVGKDLVGYMEVGKRLSNKKQLVVEHVQVIGKEFKSTGIGTAMYQHLLELSKRAKIKEIGSTDIISKNALAIRNKFGSDFFSRTAAGALRKITFEKALNIIGDLDSPKTIRAITKVIK